MGTPSELAIRYKGRKLNIHASHDGYVPEVTASVLASVAAYGLPALKAAFGATRILTPKEFEQETGEESEGCGLVPAAVGPAINRAIEAAQVRGFDPHGLDDILAGRGKYRFAHPYAGLALVFCEVLVQEPWNPTEDDDGSFQVDLDANTFTVPWLSPPLVIDLTKMEHRHPERVLAGVEVAFGFKGSDADHAGFLRMLENSETGEEPGVDQALLGFEKRAEESEKYLRKRLLSGTHATDPVSIVWAADSDNVGAHRLLESLLQRWHAEGLFGEDLGAVLKVGVGKDTMAGETRYVLHMPTRTLQGAMEGGRLEELARLATHWGFRVITYYPGFQANQAFVRSLASSGTSDPVPDFSVLLSPGLFDVQEVVSREQKATLPAPALLDPATTRAILATSLGALDATLLDVLKAPVPGFSRDDLAELHNFLHRGLKLGRRVDPDALDAYYAVASAHPWVATVCETLDTAGRYLLGKLAPASRVTSVKGLKGPG